MIFDWGRVCGRSLGDARRWNFPFGGGLLCFNPATIPLSRDLSAFPSAGLHGRVLSMERAMEEILDRQDRMPARLGKPARPATDIAKTGRQQVRHAKSWFTGRGIPVMSVSDADHVYRPDEALPLLAAVPGAPPPSAAWPAGDPRGGAIAGMRAGGCRGSARSAGTPVRLPRKALGRHWRVFPNGSLLFRVKPRTGWRFRP